MMRILFIVVVILVLFSCHKEDEELIPSFISVESIDLVANPSIQHLHGSLSEQITDVWVYIADAATQEFIGAFELPSMIPVLKEGPHTVTLRAGIKINGISETRGIYPFYEDYKVEINLVRDSVIILKPRVSYSSTTQFPWVEDFEDGNSSLYPSSRSDTTVLITDQPEEVFEGDYSGKVRLDELRFFFEALTNEAYVLPKQGVDVYLEMDFKTDNEVVAGLFINLYDQSVQSPVVILNETNEWKKIYINLLNAVNLYNNSINYNVFLTAVKDDAHTDATILVDNLKLVHK
jgi:hypothetical protein